MAHLRPGAEKRGPKIGDAASLWNFTPSPGWTKEEAQVLRLCLMKHGVGRWVQILDTGLLPGKMIQQLNGQTQRLLGQQSLAAYTGLQVDVDRIRADNEAKADAPRKSGLIINAGPNLTKDDKERLQAEAKAKYGLSEGQIQEVEDQLAEVAAARAAKPKAEAPQQPDLMEAGAASLSRQEKLALLRRLHARLAALAAAAAPAAAAPGAAAEQAQPSGRASVEQENAGGASANADAAAPMAVDAPRAAKPAPKRKSRSDAAPGDGGSRPAAKPRAKAKPASKRAAAAVSDDDAEPAGTSGGGAQAQALATLQAMGFSAKQAREALDDADGDVESAADWLMANCL